MAERTEEDALAGVLRITVGGGSHVIPTLKIKHSREWKAKLGDTIGSIELPASLNGREALAALAKLPADAMFDLVVDYVERTGTDLRPKSGTGSAAASDREWLEENADDREVYEALQLMILATFPFITDLRSAAAEFGPRIVQAVREELRGFAATAMVMGGTTRPESSTSSPSPNGDSTPTQSEDGSQTSS